MSTAGSLERLLEAELRYRASVKAAREEAAAILAAARSDAETIAKQLDQRVAERIRSLEESLAAETDAAVLAIRQAAEERRSCYQLSESDVVELARYVAQRIIERGNVSR